MKPRDIPRFLSEPWRFPLLRRFRRQCSPRYWRFERARHASQFFVKKLGFKAKERARGTVAKASIFAQVLKAISLQLIIAVLLVVLLAFIERHLKAWKLHWFDFPLSQDAQRDLFATLGHISATFLPLYLTALSVVVSTAYARVPGNIRSLIMREQVGSMYFAILAQFVAVVTVMLTGLAFGYSIGPLNTWLASFLCLYATFAFVVLGVRAFEYFSPTALVSLLNRDLLKEIRSVTPSGYQWADTSFQAHHQRNAEELLNSYSDLVTVASQKENLHGKGLVELGQGLLLVLNLYASLKPRIPSSSYWFRRTYRHKNWLLTSYTEVEMALVTGTTIQPDAVPDLTWFETDGARLLREIFHQLGRRRYSAGTIALASSLQTHLGGMAQCLAVPEALQIFDAVAPILRSQSAAETNTSGADTSETTNRLAVAELYSLTLINILLGTSNQCASVTPASLREFVASVNWLRPETLYPSRILPRKVIQQLEFIQERLAFECRVEGNAVTPTWFQQEIAALGHVRFLDEVTQAIVTQFELTFRAEADKQLAAKNHVLVAQLVQRGLEACEKASQHFKTFQGLHEQFRSLNLSKEYVWPEIGWDALQERIAAVREYLVRNLAKASAALSKRPESLAIPDFFGHAYSVLAEECFSAMAAGKEDVFQEVFSAFFSLAILAHEKLRQKFLGDLQNIRLSIEPVADLMALSGYSAVFSELDNKGFWRPVQQRWDNYLMLFPDNDARKSLIEFLCVALQPDWRIAPRSVMRTRWQQMMQRVFAARGLFPERAFWESHPEHSVSKHASPLVRFFCRSFDLHTDPCDVFMALYAFKRPESASLKKPHDVEYIEKALQPQGKEEEPSSADE